jgi:hypothetical protein
MADPSVTELRMTDTDRVWTFVLLGGGGGALLLVLPWLLDLVSGFPLVPFEAVAEWVAGFDEPWAWAVRLVVGGLLGSALAAFAIADEHRILLSDDGRVLFDETVEAPRDQVREAFLAHAYPRESS